MAGDIDIPNEVLTAGAGALEAILGRSCRWEAQTILAAAVPLIRAQVAAELIAKAREVQAAIDDPATDPDVMSTLIDEAEGLWSAVRTVDEALWRREWEATQGGDRG